VGGQRHTPAGLSPGKGPENIPIVQEVDRAPESD